MAEGMMRWFKIGGGAAVGAIAAKKGADKLFTTETDVVKRETWRGAVEIAGGLGVGYLVYRYDKDFAVGLAAGAVGHGSYRIAVAKNWFSLGTPASTTAPTTPPSGRVAGEFNPADVTEFRVRDMRTAQRVA